MNRYGVPLVIGIGGVTSGGKTTLCQRLTDCLPATVNVVTLHMDDYYKEVLLGRADNWETIDAVDFCRLHEDLKRLLVTPSAEICSSIEFNDWRHNRLFKEKNNNLHPVNAGESETDTQDVTYRKTDPFHFPYVVLVEGILIYQYAPLQKHFHQRYFVTLGKKEAFKRRLKRNYFPTSSSQDQETYAEKKDYFDRNVWPCFLESLENIKTKIGSCYDTDKDNNVTFLDGNAVVGFNSDLVLRDIIDLLHQTVTAPPNSDTGVWSDS